MTCIPWTMACVYDRPGCGHPRAPLFHVTAVDDTRTGSAVTPRDWRSATIASHRAGGSSAGVPGLSTGPGVVLRNGGRADAGGVGSAMGPPEHAVSESSR